MAGYIGTKAVNLSTTGADIAGDADVSGALDVGGAFTSQGIDDNANAIAITIDSSENVGIGTSLPSDVLHVVTPTFGGMTLECTGATADPTFKFLGDSGNYWSLQQDASQGDSFQFRYNNSEKVRIDSAGRVTMPYQPYFNVTTTGSSYTLGNNDTLVFNRVVSNVGSHYSSSTGRFTAPIAGKYLFIFQTIVQGNYNNASIRYYKNGSRFYGSDMHFSPYLSASNYWDGVHNNQIVAMNANDYLEIVNVGPNVTYHGDHWSHFTGMLLG
jgi:hypothetical protein